MSATLQTKSIELADIGLIQLRKSDKASRIIIRVAPGKGVQIIIPTRNSFDEGISFAKSRIEWIKTSVAKISTIEQKQKKIVESCENITRFHSLILKQNQQSTIRIQVAQNKILVSFPATLQADNHQVQDAIKTGITHALRVDAKKYLPIRTAELARKHNLAFNNISFRDQKTRWGSCSGENNISLSIQLMRLPSHLCDYVILHELAHTIHKNHGPQFWKFLDKLCNQKAILLRKELRNFSV